MGSTHSMIPEHPQIIDITQTSPMDELTIVKNQIDGKFYISIGNEWKLVPDEPSQDQKNDTV